MPRPSLDDADSLAGSEAGSHTDGLSLADATETASLARSDAVSMAASTRSVAASNAGSESARRPDMPISVFVDQTTDVRAPRPPLPWHPSHRTHDSSLWVVRRVALAPRTQPFPQPTEQPGHALLIDHHGTDGVVGAPAPCTVAPPTRAAPFGRSATPMLWVLVRALGHGGTASEDVACRIVRTLDWDLDPSSPPPPPIPTPFPHPCVVLRWRAGSCLVSAPRTSRPPGTSYSPRASQANSSSGERDRIPPRITPPPSLSLSLSRSFILLNDRSCRPQHPRRADHADHLLLWPFILPLGPFLGGLSRCPVVVTPRRAGLDPRDVTTAPNCYGLTVKARAGSTELLNFLLEVSPDGDCVQLQGTAVPATAAAPAPGGGQLRHHFWTKSRAFLSSTPLGTRFAPCATSCPC